MKKNYLTHELSFSDKFYLTSTRNNIEIYTRHVEERREENEDLETNDYDGCQRQEHVEV